MGLKQVWALAAPFFYPRREEEKGFHSPFRTSTLLCWTYEEAPNGEQAPAVHRGLLAVSAPVLKKFGIKEEILLKDSN